VASHSAFLGEGQSAPRVNRFRHTGGEVKECNEKKKVAPIGRGKKKAISKWGGTRRLNHGPNAVQIGVPNRGGGSPS